MNARPDEQWMQEALKEARRALDAGEVPIGAVVVCEGRVIARGHNQVETLQDATAHAEMIALTSAMHHLGAKYITDCELFVTVEPCPMCAGALAWAQVKRVVYGAADEKKGYSRHRPSLLHPKAKVSRGVLQEECSEMMKDFFRKKRR